MACHNLNSLKFHSDRSFVAIPLNRYRKIKVTGGMTLELDGGQDKSKRCWSCSRFVVYAISETMFLRK